MLTIRPICEHCAKALPNTSAEAMICTFECTFCRTCVEEILHNVCPNCGGGFEKRPTRPAHLLEKYPVGTEPLHKPVVEAAFQEKLDRFRGVPPGQR